MADSSRLGGKIGGRVAGLVADATVITKAKTAKINHDVALKIQDSFFRIMGSEIHGTVGEVFREIADNPDVPPFARRTFDFLGRQHGQWQAFLAQAAAGQAMSVGLGDIFNAALAPASQAFLRQLPNFLVPVGSAASMAARGLMSFREAYDEARSQGINTGRFSHMIQAAWSDLSPGDILTLLNRGAMGTAQATTRLRNNGMHPDAISHFLALHRTVLTPEQAAELENFGVLTREQGRQIASFSGMAPLDYDRLAQGGGQPPALGDLLEAFRRGIINSDRLERGIQQGPTRIEWTDMIKRMRFRPTPAEAALSAGTQNLIPPAEAIKHWVANGFDPGDFEWALESNGRPLGLEQTAELFNKGEITKEFANQMYLESAIKNKYVPLIPKLFERLPPMELTIRMARDGIMTPVEAITNLRHLGFAAKWAQALVDQALTDRVAEDKALSVSIIRELFEAQQLTKSAAHGMLVEHGYTAQHADWLLSLNEIRRDRSRVDSALSRVRARYVTGKITEPEMLTAIDQLGILAAARDDFIETWKVERDISAPDLTVAQMGQAVKRGLMPWEDMMRRLLARGYSEEDAIILVTLVIPEAEPEPRGRR